jgi:hypothetical protein
MICGLPRTGTILGKMRAVGILPGMSGGGGGCFVAVEREEDLAADLGERGETKEQNPGHLKTSWTSEPCYLITSHDPSQALWRGPRGHCQALPHTGGGEPRRWDKQRCKQQSPNQSFCLFACLERHKS